MNTNQLSKLISQALRHRPDKFKITLDEQGWVPLDELLSGIKENLPDMDHLTIADIQIMVKKSIKKRHEIKDGKIRAIYAHSVPVAIERPVDQAPSALYHGTLVSNCASIMDQGLIPGSRQSVHLAEKIEDALAVARRHGENVTTLNIDAAAAEADGIKFSSVGSGIWITEHVPSTYITVEDNRPLDNQCPEGCAFGYDVGESKNYWRYLVSARPTCPTHGIYSGFESRYNLGKTMTYISDLRVEDIDIEPQGLLRISYGSCYIKVNKTPYLTITGDFWEKRPNKNSSRWDDPDYCGSIRETITKHTDQFNDLIALHLSNALTGEPLHALENGFYHLENGHSEKAAKLLRIDAQELTGIATKDQLAQLIESKLKSQWQSERDAVVEKYGLKMTNLD